MSLRRPSVVRLTDDTARQRPAMSLRRPSHGRISKTKQDRLIVAMVWNHVMILLPLSDASDILVSNTKYMQILAARPPSASDHNCCASRFTTAI